MLLCNHEAAYMSPSTSLCSVRSLLPGWMRWCSSSAWRMRSASRQSTITSCAYPATGTQLRSPWCSLEHKVIALHLIYVYSRYCYLYDAALHSLTLSLNGRFDHCQQIPQRDQSWHWFVVLSSFTYRSLFLCAPLSFKNSEKTSVSPAVAVGDMFSRYSEHGLCRLFLVNPAYSLLLPE